MILAIPLMRIRARNRGVNGTAVSLHGILVYTDCDSPSVVIRSLAWRGASRITGVERHMSDNGWEKRKPGQGHRGTLSRAGARASAGSRGGSLPVGSAAIGTLAPEPYRYTMADLERETGLSPRTIRFYITEGLLPAARGRGVGATYGPAHLLRLKAINLLKKEHTPLDEIRKRLEGMRDAELAAMLEVKTAPAEDRWRRVMLHPDLELHVRERGERGRDYEFERVVDTIVKQSEVLIAQQLGERD